MITTNHSKPRNSFQDLAGQRFGRLTVIKRAFIGKGNVRWHCYCNCGEQCTILASQLKSGRTTSCGCYRREASRARQLKHGAVGTPEYTTWASMRQRCLDPGYEDYKNYGGRGVCICSRWEDFLVFLADMGTRPPGKTLERRDVNGDYTPENCCWATQQEQQRNRRNNHLITYKGRTQCLVAWAEQLGFDYATLRDRLNRYGYTIEEALTLPLLPRKRLTCEERGCRARAQGAVTRAVARGDLVRPKVCPICQLKKKVQAHHHRGYEKQHYLDIIWACARCHARSERNEVA